MTYRRTTRTRCAMATAVAGAVALVACMGVTADEVVAGAEARVIASAPEHISQPPVKVAVVRFASEEVKPFTSCSVTVASLKDAGAQLSRQVADKLAGWPEYTILDSEAVWKVVEKHHLTRAGLDNPEVARKLARLTGADAVVIGEADGTVWSGNGHQGGNLYASFRMLSTADAKVLWAVDGQVQDTESVGDLVADLVSDTTARLFAQLQASQGRGLVAMSEPRITE